MSGFAFGWKTGFEPATLGTTNRYSNQLSYIHHFTSEKWRAQIYKFFYMTFIWNKNFNFTFYIFQRTA